MLYIEAMQDAKEDTTVDPRRNNHKTGKDRKFVAAKNGSLKFTVTVTTKLKFTVQLIVHGSRLAAGPRHFQWFIFIWYLVFGLVWLWLCGC